MSLRAFLKKGSNDTRRNAILEIWLQIYRILRNPFLF